MKSIHERQHKTVLTKLAAHTCTHTHEQPEDTFYLNGH